MSTINSKQGAIGSVKADVKRAGQKAAYSPLMEALTRLGYAVRGLIYITMGVLEINVMFYICFFGFIWFLAFSLLKPSMKRGLLPVFFGVLVLTIGVSRVYLGKHWASDALADASERWLSPSKEAPCRMAYTL